MQRLSSRRSQHPFRLSPSRRCPLTLRRDPLSCPLARYVSNPKRILPCLIFTSLSRTIVGCMLLRRSFAQQSQSAPSKHAQAHPQHAHSRRSLCSCRENPLRQTQRGPTSRSASPHLGGGQRMGSSKCAEARKPALASVRSHLCLWPTVEKARLRSRTSSRA